MRAKLGGVGESDGARIRRSSDGAASHENRRLGFSSGMVELGKYDLPLWYQVSSIDCQRLSLVRVIPKPFLFVTFIGPSG